QLTPYLQPMSTADALHAFSPRPQRPEVASTVLLQRPPHHPDLHSFPTRRSSDLARYGTGGSLPVPPAPGGGMRVLQDYQGWEPRSEEHTSELQSRGHLVCRLLLEKKNQLVFALRPPGGESEIGVQRRGVLHLLCG